MFYVQTEPIASVFFVEPLRTSCFPSIVFTRAPVSSSDFPGQPPRGGKRDPAPAEGHVGLDGSGLRGDGQPPGHTQDRREPQPAQSGDDKSEAELEAAQHPPGARHVHQLVAEHPPGRDGRGRRERGRAGGRRSVAVAQREDRVSRRLACVSCGFSVVSVLYFGSMWHHACIGTGCGDVSAR